MKKLLFLCFVCVSLIGSAQINSLPVVYEDRFNTIDPNLYPVIFLTSRNGFSGNVWKIIPNDRRTPESDSVRKHSSGLRYRRISFAVANNDPSIARIYRPVQASIIPTGSLSAWINNNSLGSTGLFWKSERLGIGTAAPEYPADIFGNIRIRTGTNQNLLVKPFISGTSGMSIVAQNDTAGLVPLEVHSSLTAFLYGKVLVNTLTNNGQNLQVSGTTLLNGTVTVGGSIVPSSPGSNSLGSSGYPFNNLYLRKIYGNGSNELEISSQSANDIGFYSSSGGTLRMKIKGTNGRVGIGTDTPTALLDINGDRIRIRNNITAPTSTSDTSGEVGDMAFDDDYGYRKTTAGWKRWPLITY